MEFEDWFDIPNHISLPLLKNLHNYFSDRYSAINVIDLPVVSIWAIANMYKK